MEPSNGVIPRKNSETNRATCCEGTSGNPVEATTEPLGFRIATVNLAVVAPGFASASPVLTVSRSVTGKRNAVSAVADGTMVSASTEPPAMRWIVSDPDRKIADVVVTRTQPTTRAPLPTVRLLVPFAGRVTGKSRNGVPLCVIKWIVAAPAMSDKLVRENVVR